MTDLDVSSAVDALTAEPLFELSMSSRELFHSNFLAWLIRTHQPAGFELVATLFGHPGDPMQTLVADREVRKIDLHIHSFSGEDIWVEVKIGAIPSKDQLERYRESVYVLGKPQRFHLLSLHEVDPQSLPEGWELVTISQLAQALERAAEYVEPEFDQALIRHEVNLLRRLVTLGCAADPTRELGELWFISSKTRRHIADTRSNTLVEKLRAGAVLEHLRRGGESLPATLVSAADLRNGRGLVEFRRVLHDGRSVGWQLQHNQFRLFAESAPVPRGSAAPVIGIQPGELEGLSDWFSFDSAKRVLGGKVLGLSPRASGIGRFGTSFVYIYRQLPTWIETGDVLNLLRAETERLSHVDPDNALQ